MAYKTPVKEPIAIIGASCRFAGSVGSPAELWEVLSKAPDLSREIPPERFNAKAFYHADGEYHGTTNSIKAYWIDDHHYFDAAFFNITPKEAEAVDPQQRLLLEVVYEALESAGLDLNSYYGKKVAVFSGVMTADYDTLSQRDELLTSQYYATGNARSIISNRVSYFYNFQGPSMTVDTACSSSLVALHQAVLSLRSGESVLACVTGTNVMMTPEQFLVESSLHMLSPTGKSRMWDASADGYARGEGIAAMLLKPLSKALADGDNVTAIIRETGVNSDGRTRGITLPNPKAQAQLIKDTYKKTGLDSAIPSDQPQYFEAHGTGTPAGDPREAEAIFDAFSHEVTSQSSPSNHTKLLVGSVKTVLGHTEGAAGLAGLLKVIQSMKHGLVPPNLHLDSINPNVRPFCARLEVPTSLVPWPSPPTGQPKRASINSFGFGGTNAHAIVELYDPLIHGAIYGKPACEESSCDLQRFEQARYNFAIPLFLSAASQKSLRDVVASYRDYLLTHPGVCYYQLAWAIFTRKTALPYRLALSANSRHQALRGLEEILNKSPSSIGTRSTALSGESPKILGVFTGQGAQWTTMSRSLFHANTVYRNTIRDLDRVLESCQNPPDWTLEGQIMAEGDQSLVHVAAISQPLCTAIQIGLVDLLRELGIGFHTVIGHSSGEIAAAYAAGRLSARDAILISYYRGYLAHLAGGSEGQRGGMLAAGLSEEEALQFCQASAFNGRLHVAASNAPSSVTLSGDIEAVQSAHEELAKGTKFSRILRVDSAYHSPHMFKPGAKYVEVLQGIGIKPEARGKGPIWVSSVHGNPVDGDEELSTLYWRDNMVNMVQFHKATVNAVSQYGPFDCALEVGPHPALKGPVAQTLKSLGHKLLYSSLLDRSKDDADVFSDFLGFMWTHFGIPKSNLSTYIQTSPVSGVLGTRLTNIPAYPWDHSRIYHRESRISRQFHHKSAIPHELLGVRTRDDNEHGLRWRNMLRLEKLPWVEHHTFQGHALLPASAYCIMAFDAAQSILNGKNASVIELHNLQILSGINVERESAGVEVLFTLTVIPQKKEDDRNSAIKANFTLASCPADGTTIMRLNMTGNLIIHLGEPTLNALPSRRASRSEAFSATPESFYKMMEQTGLVYTGPFRALKSIKRRYNYCSATLGRWHAGDTTTLSISPATLDCCFQSAFLTYAFPGDRSLWTSFLPVHIDSVRFNLARSKSPDLTVDSHMTDIQPSTPNSKATFDVDINIFDEDGKMEIQVEGLRVAALAHTLAKDDYEMYLHTITDIDPCDEIILGESDREQIAPGSLYDANLVETCARVATFFVRDRLGAHAQLSPDLDRYYVKLAKSFPPILGTIGSDYWPSDTKETIDALIRHSQFYDRLTLISLLDNFEPDFVSDFLVALVKKTVYLSPSHYRVGRIMKQIAHRYPRMNMLSIIGSEVEVMVEVLSAISPSFCSFTICHTTAPSSPGHVQLEELPSRKVLSLLLDPKKDLGTQLGSDKIYDLVLLSVSELEGGNFPDSLKNIRAVMRPGGFLVLVQLPSSRTSQFLHRSNDPDAGAQAPTPPQWPDALDIYGFVRVARNCDQSCGPGYTIMVRQLDTPDLDFVRQPSLANGRLLTSHLLIVGCNDVCSSAVAGTLKQRLFPSCEKISLRATFGDADSQVLSSCTAAIILADLDEPLMLNMTQQTLDRLRDLLRPNMYVLWILFDSRFGNPDHAATLGFTRTVSAEIPSLRLQVLDLDEVMGSGDLIADNFIRLLAAREADDNVLLSTEREIHVQDGRRLIPRVVPLKESNDGVNSMRRVISNQRSSLRECIEIIPRPIPDGAVHFEARLGSASSRHRGPDQFLIRVDYSSVEGLKLNEHTKAHMCFGYNLTTGEFVIAVSEVNASYVLLLDDQLYPIKPVANIGLPLISLAMRYLTAELIAAQAGERNIVLIDSDSALVQCVTEITSTKHKGNTVFWYSTGRFNNGEKQTPLFLHPRASARDIKAIFPPTGGAIFDFQTQGREDLSQLIRDLLPLNCEYHSNPSFHRVRDTPKDSTQQDHRWKTRWRVAVQRALKSDIAGPQGHTDFKTISLPSLQSHTEASPVPLAVVDWTADRNLELTTKYFAADQFFRPDRTYLLVGLTKDLGQSLCSLLLKRGARNIVLASRNPNMGLKWVRELAQGYAARIEVRRCDATNLNHVQALKKDLSEAMPPVGGVANGAMVLDDRIFAQMDAETWERVLRPKAVGSLNLNIVFNDPDLEFFIMTSSFAAIGGHPGQSNYAAANMYMNGLAGQRRRLGLAASVLNIGVIYGLGFLQREKEQLYAGLEREGYPPISERDIHHMFLEAVLAGRPERVAPIDLTTGLRRFDPADPNPLHWHQDPRFSHYSRIDSEDVAASTTETRKGLKDIIADLTELADIAEAILTAFTEKLRTLLQLPEDAVIPAQSISELGVDSLAAVEIRGWIFKMFAKDVSVIKLLGGTSIQKLCTELSEQIVIDRSKAQSGKA